MRNILIFLLLFSFGAIAYPGMDKKSITPAPDLKNITVLSTAYKIDNGVFYDGEGEKIEISSLKGKIVILNFWATWCPPCIRELPAINRLEKSLGDDKFIVIPISIDSKGKEEVDPFIKNLRLNNFKSYYDKEQKLGALFPLDYIPASFILNQNGDLIAFARTYIDWDDEELQNALKKLYIEDKE